MKLPWSKTDTKSAASLIALAHLPTSDWGRADPAALVRDGYAGNAVAYRCVRMIAEAAASISLSSPDRPVQRLLTEPSPEQAGQALADRLQRSTETGRAPDQAVPR